MSDQAGHVLASIDGALGDWDISADAMRWTADREVLAGAEAGEQPATGEAPMTLSAFGDAFARALTEWMEQVRPVIAALGEIASRPEHAAIKAARARPPVPLLRPCTCFCGAAHPAAKGICDGEQVAVRRYVTEAMGSVVVPLCASCAAAVNAERCAT